ncbi:class I SAM-dependent methyltransferase [Streptomyces sp. NPDC059037]|uniref:class I SAM-dependent methyltransferase n=1 Tax=Streptomyces sp. NPDC059037 TaxID=3346710 RepID=UPI0036C10DBC
MLRGATSPDDLYADPPPWDIGRPQPAFLALAETGAIKGRVLDVGCGTGEHVLLASGLGLDVTGVDLAPNALLAAEEKARDRNRTVRFLRHDARRLAELRESFDTVLDCGLFHGFDEVDRASYVDGLGAVHKVARNEVEDAFAGGWQVDSIEPSTIDITTDPQGIRAWLVGLTRI